MKRALLLQIGLGLVLGVAAGLYYTWELDPVSYINTDPASLRADFRDDHLALIASAYAATGDLERARARLSLFPEGNNATYLGALAQRRLSLEHPESEARALALLASALGAPATRVPVAVVPTSPRGTAPPSGPTVPATSAASPAATGPTTPTVPTVSPAATPRGQVAFALGTQERVCSPALGETLLQVVVSDLDGQPLPGIEVLVVWDDGQDHFFTGLKPDLGLGYGDFSMSAGVLYSLQIVGASEAVTGLRSEACFDQDGSPYPGSWRLNFQQGQAP